MNTNKKYEWVVSHFIEEQYYVEAETKLEAMKLAAECSEPDQHFYLKEKVRKRKKPNSKNEI